MQYAYYPEAEGGLPVASRGCSDLEKSRSRLSFLHVLADCLRDINIADKILAEGKKTFRGGTREGLYS